MVQASSWACSFSGSVGVLGNALTIPRSDRTRSHHWSAGEGRNSPGRFPCNAHSKRTTQEKCYGKCCTFFVSCRTAFARIQPYGCGLCLRPVSIHRRRSKREGHDALPCDLQGALLRVRSEAASWRSEMGLAPSAGMRSLSASRISSRSRTSSTSRAIMKNRWSLSDQGSLARDKVCPHSLHR